MGVSGLQNAGVKALASGATKLGLTKLKYSNSDLLFGWVAGGCEWSAERRGQGAGEWIPGAAVAGAHQMPLAHQQLPAPFCGLQVRAYELDTSLL